MRLDAPGGPSRTAAQRRRDRERAAARESILSAARELARREGWDAVTMRRLADEIEYSANFAYRYFEGRDDILLTLVRDGFTRLRDTVAAAAQPTQPASRRTAGGTASNGAADAVRRAGHAYLDFALTEPDLYQLMYSLGGVRVPATDTWTEGQAIGDVFIGLLAAAGDDRREEHVLQLWATAHGLIALQVVGRVDVDATALHALLDNAFTDCLARASRAGSIDQADRPIWYREPSVNTLTTGMALVAVATTALIYGTDVFCALVMRPAAAGAADSSVADLLGRVHEYGDRRLPAPGAISVIATALATATSDTSTARVAGAIALVALLAWLAIYIRISAPINKRLRAAAASHTTPPDTRALQHRWDSVIWTRAMLEAVALAGLLTLLLTR